MKKFIIVRLQVNQRKVLFFVAEHSPLGRESELYLVDYRLEGFTSLGEAEAVAEKCNQKSEAELGQVTCPRCHKKVTPATTIQDEKRCPDCDWLIAKDSASFNRHVQIARVLR